MRTDDPNFIPQQGPAWNGSTAGTEHWIGVGPIQEVERKTPEQIAEQRAKGWPDWHPEDYCHKCGRPNVKPWYTDSALWNQAAPVNAIWCPQCFVKAYEEVTGARPIWRLVAEEPR